MSLISLTNACFKACVMKNKPRQLQEEAPPDAARSKAKV